VAGPISNAELPLANRDAAAPADGRSWRPRPSPRREGQARKGLVSRLIVGLDASLRRGRGVTEFAGASGTILRVAVIPSDVDARLPSGLVVRKGDPVIELHFANERLPQADDGAGFGWAAKFGRQLVTSFRELAVGVQIDPRLKDAKAVLGRLAFSGERNREDARRFGHRFGFETAQAQPSVPPARRLHDFGEDLWLVGLTWAFNRGSLKGRSVLRLREDLWMSPEELLTRYGPPADAP
jgi:YkoP domain